MAPNIPPLKTVQLRNHSAQIEQLHGCTVAGGGVSPYENGGRLDFSHLITAPSTVQTCSRPSQALPLP